LPIAAINAEAIVAPTLGIVANHGRPHSLSSSERTPHLADLKPLQITPKAA